MCVLPVPGGRTAGCPFEVLAVLQHGQLVHFVAEEPEPNGHRLALLVAAADAHSDARQQPGRVTFWDVRVPRFLLPKGLTRCTFPPRT